MQTLIESYRIHPGEHCGSTAMRSLLEHYCGLALPEPAVFGLGSGLHAMLISGPQMDPSPVLFGRTGSFELDVGRALGLDYREETEADDARAWELVRDAVRAGRPTMLAGDIFYLDYREFKVHFPSHRFVLVGFDDASETAFIADRIHDHPERCSYGAVARSRNAPEGLSSHNLWGRFESTTVQKPLEEAARDAIRRCARRMLGEDGAAPTPFGEGAALVEGVSAITAFADDLRSWAVRDDVAWLASYNARCIEKFGNGGGNFRRLYTGFLEWARELDGSLVPVQAPAEAQRAADAWTDLAEQLFAASEAPEPGRFEAASSSAHEIAEIEKALFQRLLEAVE